MGGYSRMSREALSRALHSVESEPLKPDELKHLLSELQRHQLELEMQNRELREAQQALEESRSQYADLYDFAPMACLSLDERACIQELNLAGAALLRQERSHLRGHPFLPFVDPPDVSRFLTHVRLCIAGDTLSTELRLRIAGARIEVRLHGAPAEGGGPHRRMCRMAILDITELRQMQFRLSLAERLATVGTLATAIAHEINNPLAFLMGSLTVALRTWRDPDAQPSVDTLLSNIQVGAERIQDIVKDLATFTRPTEATPHHANVQQVLDLSVKMAQTEIRHRARLVRDYVDVPEVIADGSRLGQVFLNLLVNAAQAIPEGAADRHEITLRIRPSGQSVLVQIQDTGQGIPSEALERIFDPFFTTKPVGQGMGLGLAISHTLVSQLGGELSAQSEPGQGSVFSVRLPAAAPALPAPPPPVPERLQASRRGTILIVDDEPRFGQTLQVLLKPEHEVTYLAHAHEALNLLREGARYDAILCDLMMAEVTGKQFHEELCHLAPEQARRVIFMTGGAFTPAAQGFVEKLSNPLITKPFKPEALEKLLAAFLREPFPD